MAENSWNDTHIQGCALASTGMCIHVHLYASQYNPIHTHSHSHSHSHAHSFEGKYETTGLNVK